VNDTDRAGRVGLAVTRYPAPLWTDVTLCGQVEHHARQRPDAIAVIDRLGARQVTYGQLYRDAGVVAARLAEAGASPGQFVSIQLPNTYEAVVAALGAYAAGAAINPLLPIYRENELSNAFRTLKPAAFVSNGEYRGVDHRVLYEAVADSTGIRPFHVVSDGSAGEAGDLESWLREPGSPRLWRPQAAGQLSEVIFTSGTEARPKAVMHTEQTANQAVRSAYDHLGLSARDVVWMPSPVGHSTGFNYGVRMALYFGLPLVLQDRWNAQDAEQLIAATGCTYTLAATTFLQDLVDHLENTGKKLAFPFFGCGGAPIPSALVERAGRVGITALRLYGSTEVLVATWNKPDSPLAARLSTEGSAVPGIEIEVRDDAGNRLADEQGELFVRGPSTSVAFFEDIERTAAVFQDGWVRTGDIGRIDPSGNFTMISRKKEIIIRGGLNIAAAEIEEWLLRFDEVQRVAVAAVPDRRLGERVCAYLVLRPGASLDLKTMQQRLTAAGMATFKLPEFIRVLDELPMTPSGKVQKHRLPLPDAALPQPPSLLMQTDALRLERVPLRDAGHFAALLTLDRPEVLNAISWDMIRDVERAAQLVKGDQQFRTLLITGAGDAFSVGGDLVRYIELQADPVAFPQFLDDFHRTVLGLRDLPIPVIALVNGTAVAGGLEIILCCDIVFASDNARIGDGHQNFGQMGGGGILTLLARMIGWQRACELIFTGKLIPAEEAQSLGLVNRVVPSGELMAAGLEFSELVARKSFLSIRQAKSVMSKIWSENLTVETASSLEKSANAYYCLLAEDAREGLEAFQQKRRPNFQGR
jgi:acyl-CoA synthetase (AMP-forming)/AMP-acid ligase II/enoyl-CoA hydratase/carnithine racemase